MTPKKALLILLIIAIIIVIIFAFIFYVKQAAITTKEYNAGKERAGAVKQSDEQLTEEQKREAVIHEKITEKAQKIKEEAKDRPYTQDEIDFILNPRKTVEKELSDN